MVKVRLLEGATYEGAETVQDCELATVPRIGEQISIRTPGGIDTYAVEMVEHRPAGEDPPCMVFLLVRNTGFFTPTASAGR